MPKCKITGQGQMENSFLEHNFHILCLIFIALAMSTINRRCASNIYQVCMTKVMVTGQGQVENLMGKMFLVHNFQILC